MVLEQLRLVCSWVLAIFVCALVRTLILADFRFLVASDVNGGFLRITGILGITLYILCEDDIRGIVNHSIR